MFFMNPDLEWSGPLNQAVLHMAGPELDAFVLDTVQKPKCGEVYRLPGLASPYKALFMGILNPWDGGIDFEDRDLVNCYRRTIDKAQDAGIKNVAFPAMGHDKRDFPHIRFARLALQGILDKLDNRLDEVRIVCRDRRMVDTYTERLKKYGWKG